jgi:hypothetical protein
MLFDIEDYMYWGLIGSTKRSIPEKKLPNKVGAISYSSSSDVNVTAYATYAAHFISIDGYFKSAIKLLPFEKKENAVNSYFTLMEKARDLSIKMKIYTSMIDSLPVKIVDGGKQFVEGDYFWVKKNVYSQFENKSNEAPYIANGRGLINPWDPNYDPYSEDSILYQSGEKFDNVAVFTIDPKFTYEGQHIEAIRYTPFDENISNEYFQAVKDFLAAEKTLMEACEDVNVVFSEVPVIPVINKVKFKHSLAANQNFTGKITSNTGFVKFVIGKEEYLFGDGVNEVIDFSIQVLSTSKKSGYFFACDATGFAIGDILEIEIDSTSELTSLNASLSPLLTRLVANGSNLTTLSLTKNVNLTYLDVSLSPSLSMLSISGLDLLETVICNGCSITSLSLSGMTSLSYLNAADNKLGSIDFTGLTSLSFIDVGDNFVMPSNRTLLLSSLDASGVTGGTLTAPLEGLKPEATVYYDNLIDKEWTLGSDGVPVPTGIYGEFNHIDWTFSGTVISSTGFAKIVTPNGETILEKENNNGGVTYQDILNIPRETPLSNAGLSVYFDVQGFNGGFSIHPCDVNGNIEGEIYGFGLNESVNVDIAGIDQTKLVYLSLSGGNIIKSIITDSNLIHLYMSNISQNPSTDTIDLTQFPLLNYFDVSNVQDHVFEGIESLPNIASIYIYDSRITTLNEGILNMTGCTNLINLQISNMNYSVIQNINLSGMEYIYNATFTNLNYLVNVDYSDSSVVSITMQYLTNSNFGFDISGCSNLYFIQLISCRLKGDYVFDNYPSLHSIDINGSIDIPGNNVNSITVSNCPALYNLTIYSNPVSIINMSNLPTLRAIQIQSLWFLDQLNIGSDLNNLWYFNITSTSQSVLGIDIDGSKMPNLKELTGTWTKFKSLSLGTNLSLEYLDLQNAFESVQGTTNISLDLSGKTFTRSGLRLRDIKFYGTLNLTNVKKSFDIDLYGNKFSSINLTGISANLNDSTNGPNVYISQATQLSSITGLNNNPGLQYLSLYNIPLLTSLDFSNSTKCFIEVDRCNGVTSINASGVGGDGPNQNPVNIGIYNCNALTSLNVTNSIVSMFRVANCPLIQTISTPSGIRSVDSNRSPLSRIDIWGNSRLNVINGLNDKYNLTYLSINSNGSLNNWSSTTLNLSGTNRITTLYVMLNTSQTPALIDGIINHLAASGLSNGYAAIQNNKTSASSSGYNTLLSRGWRFGLYS